MQCPELYNPLKEEQFYSGGDGGGGHGGDDEDEHLQMKLLFEAANGCTKRRLSPQNPTA
jgi:hypothetical protein